MARIKNNTSGIIEPTQVGLDPDRLVVVVVIENLANIATSGDCGR